MSSRIRVPLCQAVSTRDASPRDVVAAFKAAFHLEWEEQGGDSYWPEYVYARGGDTDCLLCGLQPLPSSSHLSPDNTCA